MLRELSNEINLGGMWRWTLRSTRTQPQLIMATLMGVVGTRDAHVYTRTHTCAHTRDEKETEAASDGEEKRTQL